MKCYICISELEHGFILLQLLNTISTSELSQLLNQPDVVKNSTDICIIFSNYNNTPSFLENVCPRLKFKCIVTYMGESACVLLTV